MSMILFPGLMSNSFKGALTKHQGHRLGQPLEVIVIPFLRYIPGTNPSPSPFTAGPPTFIGATDSHCLLSHSVRSRSHVKATDIWTSSYSGMKSSGSPKYTSWSSGLMLVFVGNTLAILKFSAPFGSQLSRFCVRPCHNILFLCLSG
ncbi:hypothetical protein ES703_125609 [subsurface metagenome]